jgi:hypothetical protein
VYEPEPSGPIRLKQRDRFALAYRVGGMILGLALLAWSIATSSSGPWTIALFVLVTVGGAISYHVLTSVIRCPGCNARMINISITSHEPRDTTEGVSLLSLRSDRVSHRGVLLANRLLGLKLAIVRQESRRPRSECH